MSMSNKITNFISADYTYFNIYHIVLKAEDDKQKEEQFISIYRMLSSQGTTTTFKGKRRTLARKMFVFSKFLCGQVEYGKENKPHYHMIVFLGEEMCRNTFRQRLQTVVTHTFVCKPVKNTPEDIKKVEKYVCKGKYLTYLGYQHQDVLDILDQWKSPETFKKKSKESVVLMLRREAQEAEVDLNSEYAVARFVLSFLRDKGLTYNRFRFYDYSGALMLSNFEFFNNEVEGCVEYLSKHKV